MISKPLNFSLSQAVGDLSDPEHCVQCGPNAGDPPDREGGKRKKKKSRIPLHVTMASYTHMALVPHTYNLI